MNTGEVVGLEVLWKGKVVVNEGWWYAALRRPTTLKNGDARQWAALKSSGANV
jgi:hypothetical protein